MTSATSCMLYRPSEVGLCGETVDEPTEFITGRDRHHTQRSTRLTVAGWILVAAAILGTTPLAAWNGVGHEVVARVAWNQLDEATREEAIRLLSATEPRVELVTMRPGWGGRRDQILFERAATWPDYIRGAVPDESRPQWHYTNLFWRQDDRGRAIDLAEMKPAEVNIATELPRLIGVVADTSNSDHDRGVALAWVLHLVGDMHQPLHCSARVTAEDPRGDRGGNSFKLEPAVDGLEDYRRDNLHSLWDGALSRFYPRSFWESAWRYRERLVEAVEAETTATETNHATPANSSTMSLGGLTATPSPILTGWVEEGFSVAKRACYPPQLIRNRAAQGEVLALAATESKQRMARAGERLAEILELAL